MKPDLSRYDPEWRADPMSPASELRGDAARRPSRVRDEHRRRATAAALRLVRRFDASAPSVFAAWIDPAVARQWLFATASQPMTRARIDARAGGRFCLTERRGAQTIEHCGEYIDLVSPRRVAFTLSTPDHATETQVGVDIAPRDHGCVLTLTHRNVCRDEVTGARQRWIGILYGLDVTLGLIDAGSRRNGRND